MEPEDLLEALKIDIVIHFLFLLKNLLLFCYLGRFPAPGAGIIRGPRNPRPGNGSRAHREWANRGAIRKAF